MNSDSIKVEVVFGAPDRQMLLTVELGPAATLGEAVDASGLSEHFPAFDFQAMQKGVWNEVKPDDHVLQNGDRVEIYRPLQVDPKEARRRRAQKAKN